MEISNRLQALVNMVPDVNTVVDIGCDHGYVPIALIKEGKAKRAIAMDVNKGPLERAKNNIIEYGFESQIEIRLSNGFSKLNEGEADCAILAGMGGKLIQSILINDIEKTKKIKTLILQPQSDIEEVRGMLPGLGYSCIDEKALCEDHKYYFIMLVKKTVEEGKPYNELECRFGKYLLQRKDPILLQFILQKKEEFKKILYALSQQKKPTENQVERKKNINMEMKFIEHALKYYSGEQSNE